MWLRAQYSERENGEAEWTSLYAQLTAPESQPAEPRRIERAAAAEGQQFLAFMQASQAQRR